MTAQREMPQYQSHKKVWALKIKQVELRPANGHIIHPADEGYGPFEVSDEYVQKHNPQAGGYYVVYEDGYKSWSPAEAFLGGYKAIGPKGAATPDQAMEAAIVAAGANVAPRVTLADIETNIVSEHFFSAIDGRNGAILAETYEGRERPELDDTDLNPLKLLTFCVLILRNGTKVVGVNEGPVSPENFKPELGRQYARQKAIDQIWPMLGYELRTKLAGV